MIDALHIYTHTQAKGIDRKLVDEVINLCDMRRFVDVACGRYIAISIPSVRNISNTSNLMAHIAFAEGGCSSK